MNPPRLTKIMQMVPMVTRAAFRSNPDKMRVTTKTVPKDMPRDISVSKMQKH